MGYWDLPYRASLLYSNSKTTFDTQKVEVLTRIRVFVATTHSVASDLDLHDLSMSREKHAMLEWV